MKYYLSNTSKMGHFRAKNVFSDPPTKRAKKRNLLNCFFGPKTPRFVDTAKRSLQLLDKVLKISTKIIFSHVQKWLLGSIYITKIPFQSHLWENNHF